MSRANFSDDFKRDAVVQITERLGIFFPGPDNNYPRLFGIYIGIIFLSTGRAVRA